MPAVIAVAKSANAKTGPIAATYVSQASCPTSCPMLGNGCYAETGMAGIHTRRLNRAKEKDRLALAKEEARLIDQLPGDRKLRVHVVGDCATQGAAALVGAAMVRYERRGGKPAYSYTHAWRDVPNSAWQGAKVLASCENGAQAREAMRSEYAAALIVASHPTNKVYRHQGVDVLPCPNQINPAVTCEKCMICMSPRMLRRRRLVVGFAAHGSGAAKVKQVLEV